MSLDQEQQVMSWYAQVISYTLFTLWAFAITLISKPVDVHN